MDSSLIPDLTIAGAEPSTAAADLDFDLDSCFPKTENTFQKIDSSLRILQQVCSAHIVLSGLFLRPLYKNSSLERVAFIGATQRDNDDSTLRKNLYFLASEVKNPINFVIQLVQRGVLSLDEKDGIMRHENEHLKSLVALIYLAKKDASLYPKVLEVLNITDNEKIAQMFREAHVGANLPRIEKVTATPLQSPATATDFHPLAVAVTDQKDPAQWECMNCTYINNSNGIICEICSKTKDFKDSPENSALECPQCTFINPVGCNDCSVCSFEIIPKAAGAVAEDAAGIVAIEQEWSDDDDYH